MKSPGHSLLASLPDNTATTIPGKEAVELLKKIFHPMTDEERRRIHMDVFGNTKRLDQSNEWMLAASIQKES